MVEIPGIIFVRVVSGKISAGHVRDVFSTNANVSSRVVNIWLHHGKNPPVTGEKIILKGAKLPRLQISPARATVKGQREYLYTVYGTTARRPNGLQVGSPKQRFAS